MNPPDGAVPIVEDIDGRAWTVGEARPTAHGFDLLLGLPVAGAGARGSGVILTAALRDYLASRRYPARGVDLPLGKTAIKALRARLGHNGSDDRRAWYAARADDLADLTLEQFADRHGVTTAAAEIARLQMFGRRLRPAGWWRAPDVAWLLLNRPTAEASEALGIAHSTVVRFRAGLTPPGE